MSYAVIEVTHYDDVERRLRGKVLSKHTRLHAARAQVEKYQRFHRAGNPNSHLNIAIVTPLKSDFLVGACIWGTRATLED